jgi:DNA mismatch endonuclease (patch repair protein)
MPERWRTPFASSDAVHQKMSTLARRDTGPELALRRALHRRGLRYRVHRRPLPDLARQADIVFTRAKVAVFVDGCFWHGCPEHGRRQHHTNGWYWPNKIAANKDRDRDTDKRLRAAGWVAVRVWEHELPDAAADRVAGAITENCSGPRTRATTCAPLVQVAERRP